jgi:pimeloyl-ACP methyl ester carboxylesterase
VKLFYRKYGSGPPLIILHGLYGSSENWVSIAKSICDRFTVILPDQRNHGQSPHSPVHDYDAMKSDLFYLSNELKLNKFFLAGHSMGGKTAMSFAASWPEKLHGMVIADISPIAHQQSDYLVFNHHLEILNSILSINLTKIKTRKEVESILAAVIKSEDSRNLIMKNLKRNSNNSFSWKLNATSIRNNLDSIMGGILPANESIEEVTGFPVSFLKGEFSDYLPEDDFVKIRYLFPSAEFNIIPRSGHWIHADNPDAVKNNLMKLLDYQ